jgi:hypothetical protein
MATQTDPVAQLAATINGFCNLSNDPSVPTAQQQQLLQQVHNLSGDLIKLVTQQLDDTDAEYKQYMTTLGTVTAALTAAETQIQKFVAGVSAVADVTAAVNNLITQGIQLAGIAAKYAAA